MRRVVPAVDVADEGVLGLGAGGERRVGPVHQFDLDRRPQVLGQGVVEAVAGAAGRGRHPGIDEALDFPAGLVLRVLDIATSTYYDWRTRRTSPSRRELDDAALLEQILKVRAAHEFATTYGSPRVWLELRRQGVRVGRKRVERLMRTHGLQGAHLRRGWRHGSTRQNPAHTAAPDLVDRDFRVTEPNRLWVADLTRLVTGEGVVWLASVRDAFANRVVGWATDPRATTTLVLTALNHALRSRDVRVGQLIFHSDKGAQYTALRFTMGVDEAHDHLRVGPISLAK